MSEKKNDQRDPKDQKDPKQDSKIPQKRDSSARGQASTSEFDRDKDEKKRKEADSMRGKNPSSERR